MRGENVQPNERKMKKVIMILMTAAAMTAMSCGDGSNTARERENDGRDADNTELAEPDTTMMETDTTSTGDMDQRQDDNDMDRGESNDATERDTIQ